MKHALATAAVLLAAALIPSSASAYLVKANIQCPKILEEDANPTFKLQNNWWVLGYISAMNRANATDNGEGVSSDEIYSMLLDYCVKHPDADIDEASQYLYDSMP